MGKTKTNLKMKINTYIYTRGWSVRECTVSSLSCNRVLIAKLPGATEVF